MTILKETRRLDRIVNQIVDYARPMDLNPVSFPLSDLLDETLILLKEPLENKQIEIQVTHSSRHSFLEADRDQLKQVLLNVIQNAIEALNIKGTLWITVSDESRDQENGLLIQIKDNGKGMSSGDLARIFEPFFTTGKRRGTGLGLAICQKIIEAHRGHIEAKSRSGEGTTLSIWLPLTQRPQTTSV